MLVNECTFTSDHQDAALAKNHCTMEEAIEVGRRLKAKYTILTHFSQRYPKNLSHDQGARHEEISVKSLKERAGDYQSFLCGHDLMRVSFNDLDVVCQIRDDLEACFIDEDDECFVCCINRKPRLSRGVTISRAHMLFFFIQSYFVRFHEFK